MAPELLGAMLTVAVPEGSVAVRLTEVEAYEGMSDPASHAFRGPTRRTSVMFGPPGHLYVYFSYGMHWCANVVCQPAGTAGAVLLRAGEVVSGEQLARARRPTARSPAELARGPARLTKALGLTGAANGADLAVPDSGISLRPVPGHGNCCAGPRVGISVAAQRPWRFWLADEPSVSPYRPGRPRVAS